MTDLQESCSQYRWLVTVKGTALPIVVNELAASAYRKAGHKVEEVVPRSVAEHLADALSDAVNEMEAMDYQIHSEWGSGQYVEDETITSLRSDLAEFRAKYPREETKP